MPTIRRCEWLSVALTAMLAALPLRAAHATEIWFGPGDPIARSHLVPPPLPNDWASLFTGTTAWPITSAHITEFRMTALYALQAPDGDLQAVIGFLNAQHIKLAVSVYGNVLGPNNCGNGMESYSPPNNMLLMANRLKALGADIDAGVLDEPLWFGHEAATVGTAHGCNYAIAQVAANTAAALNQLRSVFPNMRVGEIEPVVLPGNAPVTQAQWNADLAEYVQDFTTAMGAPPQFFQADVSWSLPGWQQALGSFIGTMAAAGVPLGIVYDGSGRSRSDDAWIYNARRFYQTIDAMGIVADQVVFDDWMAKPQNNLPERNAPTLTELVRQWMGAHGIAK